MKKLLLFVLVLIFLTACEKKESHPSLQSQSSSIKSGPSKSIAVSSESKTFTFQDQNQTITIRLLHDRMDIDGTKDAVLLFFFTSWCPSCKAEMIELKKLAKKYPDLQIIGFQLDRGPKVEAPFFISHNIQSNTQIAKKVYSLLHAPASMPVPLLLLLKKNKYVIHYIGAVPIEMLEIDIKKAVGA